MKTIIQLLFVTCLIILSGCVAPMSPQQRDEQSAAKIYWMQYVPNKHVAIRSLGQPDDTSYAGRNNGRYMRLVLTWFDVKTPDGKHWDKLSFWFYNYAPDYEFYEVTSMNVVEPRLPGYTF